MSLQRILDTDGFSVHCQFSCPPEPELMRNRVQSNNIQTMLKAIAIVSLFMVGSACAFSVPRLHPTGRRTSAAADVEVVVLHLAQPDSSDAVAEARRISKEFGAASTEAKLAWEVIQASDHELSEMDYAVKVRALNLLLEDTAEKLSQIKQLAIDLKELEIEDPTLSKLPATASGLKTALQEAKAATEVHGVDSPESEAAWNEVDFCTEVMGGVECNVDSMYRYSAAALKAHHVYDAVVDATLLQEAEEAVGVLESLRKFVRIETSRLNNN